MAKEGSKTRPPNSKMWGEEDGRYELVSDRFRILKKKYRSE